MKKKRLVILDTHAILHRAYHALPDFSSPKGEPTGALYGLVSMLLRLIADLKPNYIVAAYDLPGGTYRHAAYEHYKATRPKMENDLAVQIERARDVLAAFGIPLYAEVGYEADDIVGTIVAHVKKEHPNVEVIIATGDMDALQLVDAERVRVYTLKKGINDTILYDEDRVRERFGFGPALLPDYKGLRGDPSDNIPGVKGVGEKTAMVLVSAFGGPEDILAVLKKHPERARAAGIKDRMIEKIIQGEEEAKLSRVLGQIHHEVPIEFALPSQEWSAAVESSRLLDLLAELDFRSLLPRVKSLVAPGTGQDEQGTEEGELFESNPELEAEAQKLLLAVWVLDSSVTDPTLDDVYRLGKSRNFEEAYATIMRELKGKNLLFVYEEIELPLMPILRAMEARGILVDRDFLKKLSSEYHRKLSQLATRIYAHAGVEFNINSPRQLSEVLFDRLSLSPKGHKKTPTGARSTRESELEKLRDAHPIIEDILSYRELSKLLSTYIDAIPTMLDEQDRLHTTFVQTGTATGRLSSQNPNLQNIPIKTELGRAIREAFTAPRGSTLVSLDYSQIELRIAAILSGDSGLVDIFASGRDVHAEVAARVFRVSPDEVTYEQRRRAKIINFGILYGMGVTSLQQSLGTTRAEAQEFYTQYFEAFPRLAAYLEEVKADASRLGYTETLFGRRRYMEGIQSAIPYVRAQAERMAINAPMQGTQADIIKLAMIQIDQFLKKEGLDEQVHLLLQVHDELVFEMNQDVVESVAPKLKEIMEGILKKDQRHGVPIVANVAIGKHWGDMKK